MIQIIETERLIIREFNMRDIDSLSIILLDQEVMKYSFRHINSLNDIESYIENCLNNYKKYRFGQWAVINKKNSQLIGICGLNSGFNDDNLLIHVNYRFAKTYWGLGFASEALASIINYAQVVKKIKILYALVEPDNIKSASIALNLGFQYQKETIYRGRKLVYYKKACKANS